VNGIDSYSSFKIKNSWNRASEKKKPVLKTVSLVPICVFVHNSMSFSSIV